MAKRRYLTQRIGPSPSLQRTAMPLTASRLFRCSKAPYLRNSLVTREALLSGDMPHVSHSRSTPPPRYNVSPDTPCFGTACYTGHDRPLNSAAVIAQGGAALFCWTANRVACLHAGVGETYATAKSPPIEPSARRRLAAKSKSLGSIWQVVQCGYCSLERSCRLGVAGGDTHPPDDCGHRCRHAGNICRLRHLCCALATRSEIRPADIKETHGVRASRNPHDFRRTLLQYRCNWALHGFSSAMAQARYGLRRPLLHPHRRRMRSHLLGARWRWPGCPIPRIAMIIGGGWTPTLCG